MNNTIIVELRLGFRTRGNGFLPVCVTYAEINITVLLKHSDAD